VNLIPQLPEKRLFLLICSEYLWSFSRTLLHFQKVTLPVKYDATPRLRHCSKVDRYSVIQNCPTFLELKWWAPTFLSHSNPIHNFTLYFSKIHFNIFLHFCSHNGFFPSNFLIKILYFSLPHNRTVAIINWVPREQLLSGQ
jgi:hypothetical protein